LALVRIVGRRDFVLVQFAAVSEKSLVDVTIVGGIKHTLDCCEPDLFDKFLSDPLRSGLATFSFLLRGPLAFFLIFAVLLCPL
jgi:hypothetical protein